MDADAIRHETVFDAAGDRLGQIYGRALMGAAAKAEATDEILDQLSQIVEVTFREHPTLAAVLASQRVSADERQRVVDRLFTTRVHPVLRNFLMVAAQRGRLGHLRSILEAARTLRDVELQRVVARVRTAVPLSDDLRGRIITRLRETLQEDIVLRESVDPDLLGGLVIRVGDRVYDASVSGRLEAVSHQLRSGFEHQLLARMESFLPVTST